MRRDAWSGGRRAPHRSGRLGSTERRVRLAALVAISTATAAEVRAGDQGSDSVHDLLVELGAPPPEHTRPGETAEASRALARRGELLVTRGWVEAGDPPLSRHHVCVDCHALEREDPDLSTADPDARLRYVAERGIPFLPATTLYGTVNERSWYNGHWEKYRDVPGFQRARRTLRGAIDLCARECARGRSPTSNEVDAILAFLWTKELRVSDLGLSAEKVRRLRSTRGPEARASARAEIEGRFLQASPATKAAPPDSLDDLPPGDPEVGALVFEASCLHCHGQRPGAPSAGSMAADARTQWFLLHNAANGRGFAHALREGYFGYTADEPYMPEFTRERLSDAQLAGLLAWCERGLARAMTSEGTW